MSSTLPPHSPMSDDNLSFDYDDDDELSDFSLEDNELDDKEDDQDHHLEESPASRVKKHAVRVVYEPWTLPSFIESFFVRKATVLHQRQLPQRDFGEILTMLHHCNWQEDNVINAYFDDWERLRDACGLPEKGPRLVLQKVPHFDCLICCDTYENSPLYALSCGHAFCALCYSTYVEGALSSGKLIQCMDVDCTLTLPHKDVDMLLESGVDSSSVIRVGHSIVNNRLLASAARLYVETHKLKFKWCPAVNCEHLTEITQRDLPQDYNALTDLDLANIPIVTCPESHEFCYDCQYENHLPCPCWLVKMWVKKCEDDSETANWIQANTLACPKCDAAIEKNGGCNHMVCGKCKHDFCWICLGDWSNHGSLFYECNRFDPKTLDDVKKSQQLKRLSLQRYLHFYKRFLVHELSMKGDRKTLDKVDAQMREWMEKELKKSDNRRDLSWNDVQFLHDAIRALANGRKTLKWTYCFVFYLGSSNFSEIFEQMQDFLNKTVEDLSKIFEELNDRKNRDSSSQIITSHKQEIVNLSQLVVKRQQLLIECAQTGLKQGLLKFETR